MTKSEFISMIAKKTGHTTRDVQSVLSSFQTVLLEELNRSSEIQILDLGKFKVLERAARTGVNPRDPSKKVNIPARKVPSLRPSKKFKDFVAGELKIDQIKY